MADPVSAAMQYVRDGKVEHKVAGIMMLNNALDSVNGADVEQVVAAALKAVTASFVVKMVETEDAEGRSMQVQLAGLNFIALACNSKATARPFHANLQSLLSMFCKTAHLEVREQLAACLRLICMVMGKEGRTKMLEALLSPTQCKSCKSLDALQLLTDVLSPTLESAKTSSVPLIAQQAECLRSLIVQGVHGAAPQNVRDGTIISCNQLLTANPALASAYLLDPSWTVLAASTAPGSAADSAPLDCTFPRFLCAIVRGELQMLCDEALFLASNTAASVAERFSASVPTRADLSRAPVVPVVPDTKSAEAAAMGKEGPAAATAEPAPTSDSTATAQTTTGNAESDIAYFKNRTARTVAMFVTCLQLLESILQLLIGTSSAEQSESESETEPAWCSLPSEKLLEVKKSLYGTLNDLFLFVQDCAAQLQEAGSAEKSGEVLTNSSAFMPLSTLRVAVCAVVDTLAVYAVQDAELLTVFTKCLPSMLLCSSLNGDSSTTSYTEIVHALLRYGLGDNLKVTLLSALQYDPTALGKETTPSHTPAVVQSEVVLHLLDALTALVGPSTKQYRDHPSYTPGPVQQGDEVVVAEEVLEQLFDCFPPLVRRIAEMLQIMCVYLRNCCAYDATVADIDPAEVEAVTVAGAKLAVLFRDLIVCRELKHPGELQILLRSEEDAVQSVFGVKALAVKELTAEMTAVAALLKQKCYSDEGFQVTCAELADASQQIVACIFRVVEC